ncbi:alpha/beta hydrolase [Streptomyces cacaoi]|uniref:Membrane protein n=2 Tax=Streptomyces cacaoi TaxID=1898 RepID=A0A4Y3R5P7_STRCI|nr:alpha/beta-hydrolase family protein [Streptomyces cacaoi]NNG85624.1 hypothetical protein [Streptomyces cacaoi]GEB52123.1 membrane protein [Streptomyces cacaoi]
MRQDTTGRPATEELDRPAGHTGQSPAAPPAPQPDGGPAEAETEQTAGQTAGQATEQAQATEHTAERPAGPADGIPGPRGGAAEPTDGTAEPAEGAPRGVAAGWICPLRRAVRVGAALARRPYWEPPSSAWIVRRWPGLTALCCATLFFWVSLTPSLVPRPWFLQGVIGGINAALGYAIGALLDWLVRAALRPLRRRRPGLFPGARARARAWLAYYALSIGLTIAALSWSADAQRTLRRLQEMPETLTWHSMMIALMAMAICAVLVAAARAVRLATRKLIRALGRYVPRPLAIGVGVLVSATAVLVGTRDVVFDRGVVDIAARIAHSTDQGTKEGISRPGSHRVSGGPDSLVDWDDLGYEGRNFTGSSLTPQTITAVTGKPARQPIRVYVGQQAASDATARARLAVAELERTGAFDRDVLAIAGTTGMGWVNSTDAEPLEYMHGGDTAIVAVQYSYLPSWLSFLVDKDEAGRATRALVEAVRERWLREPADDRPQLVVFGESLGAYGIEASFDGPDDMLAKVDGALLAGTPEFSPVRRQLTADRDPGSPVWRPEYENGRHFRFAQYPRRDLARPGPFSRWEHPRVVHLQNASDAIAWWNPDLAVHRPDWLRHPVGPDVTDSVTWFPVVTFWQTTVDMAVSYGVEAPHGHRYGNGSVDGWAAVAPADGWTDEDTARLREFMEQREAPY